MSLILNCNIEEEIAATLSDLINEDAKLKNTKSVIGVREMPWMMQKNSKGETCVHKENADGTPGEVVTCHATMEEAKKHMAALYANSDMKKSNDGETLAFYGSEVKALGDGKIGGYAVLFTKEPDLQGDVFTKSTDFFIRSGDERPIIYRHGMHPVIKSRPLGRGKLTIDDVGVFLEGELELRDKYEKAIYKLVELGKLGYSTGSMGHLVARTKKNKSFEIDVWPIGEVSLTPNPVEVRTSAFPLKAMIEDEIDLDGFIKSCEEEEVDQEFSLAGIPAINQFCEAVSPQSLKNGSERSRSAVSAVKEFTTIANILGEGFHSYTSRLVTRSENRFLKDGRELHPETVKQVEGLLTEMDRILPAFNSVKDALLGLHKISEMSRAEQKAMSERARLEMWNFCQISGIKPEELEDE